jgi:hypothetical protein
LSIFVTAIALVTHDNFTNSLRLWVRDLLEPVFDVLKSFSVSNGVDKCDTSSTLVVCLGDCLESLLSSCVPYLHLDLDVVDIDSFDFEVDSYRGYVCDFVLLVYISQQDVGFTYCGITDDNHFHEVVIRLLLFSSSHFFPSIN